MILARILFWKKTQISYINYKISCDLLLIECVTNEKKFEYHCYRELSIDLFAVCQTCQYSVDRRYHCPSSQSRLSVLTSSFMLINFTRTHTHTYPYIYIYIHTHIHALTLTLNHTHIYTHSHLHSHIHTHLNTIPHIFTHTHTYIHTYTHT